MAMHLYTFILLLVFSFVITTTSFHPSFRWGTTRQLGIPNNKQNWQLYSGYGIAEGYSWKEEALEIEITVQVPPGTKSKDVNFKPGLTSIDLRVEEDSKEPLVLLDGNRKLRGRISLDGTYWIFSDRRRSITVTFEKYFPHSADDLQVLDYDWKGVYPDDDDEVSDRKYDEPETLNVREYAASLGVDVDNINRSMVDETMFSSGLNLTQRALDQLKDKGYLEEVTKQADGTEYRTNPETGDPEPVSNKEYEPADRKKVKIPFLDTNSPWDKAVSVNVDPETNRTTISDKEGLKDSLKYKYNAHSQKSGRDSASEEDQQENEGTRSARNPNEFIDPIDALTVKRLKEILKKQGLKVSGTKQELQDRLRKHVNAMLQDQAKDKKELP